VPPLRNIQYQANVAESKSRAQNLLLGAVVYAKKHEGEWPENISVLLKEGIQKDESALINPRTPKRRIGYMYVRPPVKQEDLRDPRNTVVIHEAYKDWPEGGIIVGFADGHTNIIVDQAEFVRLLRGSSR